MYNLRLEFYIKATFCTEVYKKNKVAFEIGGFLIHGNEATWSLITPFFFFQLVHSSFALS